MPNQVLRSLRRVDKDPKGQLMTVVEMGKKGPGGKVSFSKRRSKAARNSGEIASFLGPMS